MMHLDFRFHADRDFARRGISFWLVGQDLHARKTFVAAPCTMHEVYPAAAREAPTFTLDDGACQDLIDQLYRLGFRPTDAGQPAGALGQAQEHIKDLRDVLHTILPAVVKPLHVVEVKTPTEPQF